MVPKLPLKVDSSINFRGLGVQLEMQVWGQSGTAGGVAEGRAVEVGDPKPGGEDVYTQPACLGAHGFGPVTSLGSPPTDSTGPHKMKCDKCESHSGRQSPSWVWGMGSEMGHTVDSVMTPLVAVAGGPWDGLHGDALVLVTLPGHPCLSPSLSCLRPWS